MSLQIGTRSFDVSSSFKEKLISSVKNDSLIDKSELATLKDSAVSEDEKSAVALLETQKDNSSNLDISITSDDGLDANSFKFNVKVENDSLTDSVVDSIANNLKTKFPIAKYGDQLFKALEIVLTKTEVSQIKETLAKVNDPELETIISNKINIILSNSDSITNKKSSITELHSAVESFEKASETIGKLPEGDFKTYLKKEITNILENDNLSPAKKNELAESIGKEVDAFSVRQVKLT
ncbi:MAG: hypothetical protein AABZ74_14340, partial [Cyanobacteriota bacterium]